MIRKLSLAWRLAIMFAVTAAVVFSCVAVFLYCVMTDSVRGQIRGELMFQHVLLDPMLRERHTEEEWQVVRQKLSGMTQAGGRMRYWIMSDDPRYRYGNALATKTGQPLTDEEIAFVKDEAQRVWCVMSRTIAALGDRPAVRFVVAQDSTSYLATKESFTRILRTTSALGILLVAALGYWIAKLGLWPVRQLSREANALPPGDPRQRLRLEKLAPEIHQLGVSFNNALARRESAWLQLEGFNADVAHELRTPLTNLIGQTQVALSQRRDVDELQDILMSNLEELERMSNIVNDMLFLSCAENGVRAAELSQVSLRHEAQKTADYLEDAFLLRDMRVTLEGDASACVDRRLFHRALANLLSNSARYARRGTQVTVTIAVVGARVQVRVADQGEPIPPAQRARLFERFYRGDAARAQSGAHHGLGLSIVRAIAVMHGGEVFADSQDGINTFGFSMMRRPET